MLFGALESSTCLVWLVEDCEFALILVPWGVFKVVDILAHDLPTTGVRQVPLRLEYASSPVGDQKPLPIDHI